MEWQFLDKRRPWSASSQIYAPADVLLDYLAHGWHINPVVGRDDYWYGGGRHVTVHYFELSLEDQEVVMPVLENPVVRRLLHEHLLRTLSLGGEEYRASRDAVDAP